MDCLYQLDEGRVLEHQHAHESLQDLINGVSVLNAYVDLFANHLSFYFVAHGEILGHILQVLYVQIAEVHLFDHLRRVLGVAFFLRLSTAFLGRHILAHYLF